MKAQIKIQTLEQLQILSTLIISNDVFVNNLNKHNVKFKFDLFEVLIERPLLIEKDASKEPEYLNFYSKEDKTLASFSIEHNSIVEYFHEENIISDETSISPNTPPEKLTEKENEMAEYAFLILTNQDLSNGWYSEDVERLREIQAEIYFLVFGIK